MKYALIEAPIPTAPEGKYRSQMPSPDNLLQIASALREDGHSVALYDYMTMKKLPPVPEDIDACVVNMSECTCMDYHLKRAVSYIRTIRFTQPHLPIYLTGFYAWLHAVELRHVGFLVPGPLTFDSEIAGDKSDSAYPLAWDLWNPATCAPRLGGKLRATIRASRGCPHRCTMCPVHLVFRQRVRRFPVDWTLHEIDTLYGTYGVREIGFLDDNLLFDKKWDVVLLQGIIDRHYKGLHFTFEEGIDVPTALDGELCSLLKCAGFYRMKLGVETFNPRTLEYIEKPYRDPEMALQAISNLTEHGLRPICFMCIGFPTDTEESIRRDIAMFENLKVKLRVQVLFPYPGIDITSPLSAAKLQELKCEAMQRTRSDAWHHSKARSV